MVCKTEVLLWFKNLESYNRIDVLNDLLKMCIPFELRFLGTCIEEIGKYTYQDLRGPAIIANDLDKLSKDTSINQNLLDEDIRHRVLISISLLSSRNYNVANWLHKNILRTSWLEECIEKGNLKDENVQNEFLLLFVMALHHPAFTFEQKLQFSDIVTKLVDFKESKSRISPKPSGYSYPPGFGYPTNNIMNAQEVPIHYAKQSIAMPCGDEALHQAPQCLPPLANQEYIQWGIPGFPCGAPEVSPFPFPTLVREPTSPSHSRSTSPHRLVQMRSTLMPSLQPAHPVETVPTPLPIETLSPSNYPFLHPPDNVKVENDDLGTMHEEKLLEGGWPTIKEVKHQNGLRFTHGVYPKNNRSPAFMDQFQALTLDGAGDNNNANTNCLQRSNSSSTSSLNHTPPETPSGTCKHQQQQQQQQQQQPPQPFVNGLPTQFVVPAGNLSLCDTTSPPPQTSFSSVPYSAYTFPAIPTRTLFSPYAQTYRPPFTTHFASYQGNENSFPVQMLQFPLPLPIRNPNCYNCGGIGHVGQECAQQNIEDITQKKNFALDYASPPPSDGDNK